MKKAGKLICKNQIYKEHDERKMEEEDASILFS